MDPVRHLESPEEPNARCTVTAKGSATGSMPGHLIEWVSKTQRHVTRATFASELFGGTDAVDQGKLLQLSLHEIGSGPGSLAELKTTAEEGNLNVALILVLDAMSVVAAVAAPTIKTPAENGLLLHLKWVRQQLDTDQLYAMCWVDTRSMAADGMTKGAIDRRAIHDALDGKWQLDQPLKVWRSPLAARRDASTSRR